MAPLIFSSNVDGYGFERGQNFDHIVYDDFMSQYLSILARRSTRWRDILATKSPIQKTAKGKVLFVVVLIYNHCIA